MAAAKKVFAIRGGFPVAPKKLGKQGRLAWDSGVALWAEGTIRSRDLFNWNLFCEAVDEKEKCEKILETDGEYQMSPNGCYAQHPALKRRQNCESVIRKYSVMFGLVPDARKKRPAVSQGVATRQK